MGSAACSSYSKGHDGGPWMKLLLDQLKKRLSLSVQPSHRWANALAPPFSATLPALAATLVLGQLHDGVSTIASGCRSRVLQAHRLITGRAGELLPRCVPLGMSIAALPSTAWALRSRPQGGGDELTGTWRCRSSSSALESWCSRMRISMYRSPGGPPFMPGYACEWSGCACRRRCRRGCSLPASSGA